MKTYFSEIVIVMSLLITSIPIWANGLQKQFKNDIAQCITTSQPEYMELITGEETNHLPDIVQKYIFRTEFFGKKKIRNMKVTFDGRIRSKPGDNWMKLKAYQISSFDTPTRIFYMKASKMGIPAIGLHRFKNGKASMKVKLLGLFTVVDVNGDLMGQAETVTHFNDMCLMAPGTLIDKNIRWEEIDPLTIKAFYTCNGKTISATLYFNPDGYLLNFISNDRYDLSDPENPTLNPFLTPIESYMEASGFVIPQMAQTVYSRPDGDFVYGEFTVKSIEYNVKKSRF
jgi:hypothetical protein